MFVFTESTLADVVFESQAALARGEWVSRAAVTQALRRLEAGRAEELVPILGACCLDPKVGQMRVIARRTLQQFWEAGHAGADQPLKAWFAEVSRAEWSSTDDGTGGRSQVGRTRKTRGPPLDLEPRTRIAREAAAG